MLNQISNEEIERAKKVLNYFIVTPVIRESALESGIFAILNQASRWERPSLITYKLREASYHGNKDARSKISTLLVLLDKDLVQTIAKRNGWRFYHENRLTPFIDYFGPLGGEWWNEIIKANSDYRNKVVDDLKYLSFKTFSFWHLCLGGTNLLPIDIHIRRQLAVLGLSIDKKYLEYKKKDHRNGNGSQYVLDEPGKTIYLKIEEDAKSFFAKDDRFRTKEGELDMGLVASILWWRGANRGEAEQGCLFNDSHGSAWKLPYGKLN